MLREWLGLKPTTPSAASGSSAASASGPRSAASSSKKRQKATPGAQALPVEEDPVKTPKHAWGGVVRQSTWPKTKKDSVHVRETAIEIHPPYTLRFEWPAGDYARWPGSGDYAFDCIRRGKKCTKVNYGAQLRRLYESGICQIPEVIKPLGDFLEDGKDFDVLGILFYKRRSRWTRVDKVDELSELGHTIESLIQRGALWVVKETETSVDILTRCYSLLTADELRVITNSGALLKERLVDKAVLMHESIYSEALSQMRGHRFIAIDSKIYSSLVRLHQFVFSACNQEPEDAACILTSGALCGEITFAAASTVLTNARVCLACWEQLKGSLDIMGLMAYHVPRGNSDHVYRGLHETSNLLLSVNHRCGCWMSSRVIENCLRINFLGVALLEREKRYEDALHYLRIAIRALDGFAVVDIDADEQDPSTLHSFHKAKAVHRLCIDLIHLDRKNEALDELERVLAEPNGILWLENSPRKTMSMNRSGGVGAGLIQLFLRLSEPPRRWKPKLPVTLVDFPEEHIVVKREEGMLVENLAAKYYMETGEWKNAQHCENGLLHTVFGLLFASDSQPRFEFDDFAIEKDQTRIQLVLDRLGRGEAPSMIRESWNKYHGKQIRGVNWERNSLDDLTCIVKNLPAKTLVMICSLFLDAYKAWSGGLSDLLLWNDRKVRFVEVKGPGDSLSDRQRAWGEKLFLSGADIAVCYVKWLDGEQESNQCTIELDKASDDDGERLNLIALDDEDDDDC